MQIRFCLLIAALCACCGLGLGAVSVPPIVTIPVQTPAAALNATEATITSGAVSDEIKPKTEPASVAPDTPISAPSSASTAATPQVPNLVTTPDATLTTTSSNLPTAVPTSPTIVPTSPTTVPTTVPTSPTTVPTSPTTVPTPPKPAPTPSPAPTPAPGPPSPPEQGKWSYDDVKTNVTCVLVQFAAQLQVTYAIANTTNLTSIVNISVPSNAVVANGSCAGDDQFITLSWPVKNSNDTNNMTLTYHKNDTTKSYGLKSLVVKLSPDNFVNSTSSDVVELNHGCDWETPLATSYRCAPATRMNLTAVSGAVGALTLSRLQEEAFRSTHSTSFNAGESTSSCDVVPLCARHSHEPDGGERRGGRAHALEAAGGGLPEHA